MMNLLPVASAILLLLAESTYATIGEQSPICASACQCLGPWAKCRSGKIEDLPGHFGPQIETMTLSYYNLPTIESSALAKLKLPNFWKLEITYCGVKRIKKHAFSGLETLLSLYLDNNEIEVIEPGAFIDLPKLNSLSIPHNKLRVLDVGVLEGLRMMYLLLLNDNQLVNINPKAFEGTQNLTTVVLKDNQLDYIDSKMVDGLNVDTQFYVTNNPFNCTCALKKEWSALRSRVVGATCSSPAALAGKSWDSLKDLNCN